MADFEQNQERPIDLFFYGQYADDAFKKRNESVERLFEFRKENPQLNIKIRLQYRTETAPVVNIPYVRRYWHKTVYPPKHIRQSRDLPTYGLDLYKDLSQSKIVFNAGVDFTKNHKVNMRNFEVLGCGAHMLSDEGIYPDNFVAGQHFTTYKNIDDCIVKIKELLDNDEHRLAIGQQGNEMVRTFHNKEVQWENFQKIVSSLS
jgi:spore maturation protein CgeB